MHILKTQICNIDDVDGGHDRVSPFKEYLADLGTRILRIVIVVAFITIFCMTHM